eukprot:TRINITY_DN34777_c0_g1_i1.p1 TRINITY_DN34777_c0_g1~~TRINITY_DN34777_c0_g1_i1.p1  ORF type:complete len:386 (-),score=21.23 TRINITY_DN34777_c0_g1_i1:188-1345(-)
MARRKKRHGYARYVRRQEKKPSDDTEHILSLLQARNKQLSELESTMETRQNEYNSNMNTKELLITKLTQQRDIWRKLGSEAEAREALLRRDLREARKQLGEQEHAQVLLQSKVDSLHPENLRLRQELANLLNVVERHDAEVTSWRSLPTALGDKRIPELYSRGHMMGHVQDLLRRFVPNGHIGLCEKASTIVVQQVDQVVNVDLWRQYCQKKHDISRHMRGRQVDQDVYDLFPELNDIIARMNIPIDRESNEVLVFHGTSGINVENITSQGFDDRLSSGRDLYGPGVYFSTDVCKCLQYSEETDTQGRHCLFISRCILGHPYFAHGPMITSKRPPIVHPYGVPHDSIIAQRGIRNGLASGQVHLEFVVRDIQAYPDLLVRFTYEA